MPPKRKIKRKPPKRSKSQSQSQRQSVVVNIGKTTTTKRRRNAGRGRLPPPSYQQNLFPPTIIQQQAPNIAVLENQISRLTSMIQEPTGIKQPTTPLGLDTQAKAKTAEAQKMAGEQAEARRPGPTAENFQVPASIAPSLSDYLKEQEEDKKKVPPSLSRQAVGEFGIDPFEFPEPVSKGRTPVGAELQRQKDTMETIREMRTNLREPVLQTPAEITEDINTRASLQFINQFDPEQVLRPPDPAFNQTLVNPADPPKMGGAGQGQGGGNIPFAQSKLKRGAPYKDPSKLTQATPADKRAEELPIQIVPTTTPRQYSKKELKGMTLPERNKIFKAVNITGENKMKQYTDLYKFGEP